MATIFVNLDANGSNNGSSWNDAYTDLQNALNDSQLGDEIWVAKGIYKPTTGINREISFVLKNGVKMYGGFAGNETSIEQRDITSNITELSGDIGTPGNSENNTYHVVDVSHTTTSSVLDGFSITNGNANNYSTQGQGGGIYSDQGNAVLSNLTIAHNNAEDGGGIYSTNSQHKVTNVFLLNNSASNDGGGIYNNSSSLILDNITFSGNYTNERGGAIYNYDSSPRITDSNFLHNGGDEGGAIYNSYDSNPIINRSIFKDNIAKIAGGGIYSNEYYTELNPLVVNSIFEGNISPDGGAIYNDYSNIRVVNSTFSNNQSRFDAAIKNVGSDKDYIPTVINSIIWNNDSFAHNGLVNNSDAAKAIINNTIVEDGYDGKNIITNNSLFINPNNFDFRLTNNSAAINAGNNDAIINYEQDLAGNKRIVDEVVDLGAYESLNDTIPQIPHLNDKLITIYVDADATGENNGSSWKNAHTDLQDAIALAPFGSQIWVAEGTYKPSKSDRNVSFNLNNGVAIYGGFAGNETELNQRNIVNNPTNLSGDIGVVGDIRDNSYHVVKASKNTTSSTILDGFTIKNGNADEYSNNNDYGGGIYATQSQAVFANLVVQNNHAQGDGGGIYTSDGLNQLINVSFVGNTAEGNGGGLYNSSTSILTNTTFRNNKAEDSGGAIFNYADDLIIDGGTFVSNIAQDNGGALHSSYSANFNIINTIFRSNKAANNGGGIYSYYTDNNSTIVNSIFDANTSELGGAIYNDQGNAVNTNLTFTLNQAEKGAAVYSEGDQANPIYTNSIFWLNQNIGDSSLTPIINDGADTFVSHSIVEGGYNGLEIINQDPKFANSKKADFRLQSDSPAIDQGFNDFIIQDTDLIGSDRIINNTVDIGAYEYFAEQDLAEVPGNIGDIYSIYDQFAMTNIHRFYQNTKGFHLYTSDANEISDIQEKSALGDLNYNYEAEQYTVLANNLDAITGEELEGVKPVYRFFNTDTGAHLYTMNDLEKNTILDNLPNYSFEGIKYYAFAIKPESIETIPVYRMLNSETNTHLFTVDQNEINYIEQNLPNYSFEGDDGVVFHVFELI